MAPERPRKPLRQRVADRKAGIVDPEIDNARKKRRHVIGTIGTVVSAVGLILLTYSVFRIGNGFPVPIERLVLFSFVFLGGRVLKAGADAFAKYWS